MPYEGPLFTSQAPFFCVFIMALLSTTEADRDVARDWFEIVVSLSGASCRSVCLSLLSSHVNYNVSVAEAC